MPIWTIQKMGLQLWFATAALALSLWSCGSGDAQQTDVPGNLIQPESDQNGVTVSKFDANSTNTQLFQASSSSAISSASVSIAPGTLAVDTDLTIEEAESLTSTDNISSTLDLGATISAGGPAVSFGSSTLVDAAKPFTISLPLSDSAALYQSFGLAEKNLVILYKVTKAKDNGGYSIGVFPTSKVSLEGNVAKVETTWFGVYQVGYADAPITEQKDIRTESPIIVKSKTNELTGNWVSSCIPARTNDQGEVEYEKQKFAFSIDRFNFNSLQFKDASCTKPLLQFAFGGSYVVGTTTATTTGAKDLDAKIESILVTIQSADFVNSITSANISFCGLTGWKVNEPRAVSDLSVCDNNSDSGQQNQTTTNTNTSTSGTTSTTSDGTTTHNESDECSGNAPRVGRTIYSLYKVDQDTMRLGKDVAPNCATTADTRNTVLDDDFVLKRP